MIKYCNALDLLNDLWNKDPKAEACAKVHAAAVTNAMDIGLSTEHAINLADEIMQQFQVLTGMYR